MWELLIPTGSSISVQPASSHSVNSNRTVSTLMVWKNYAECTMGYVKWHTWHTRQCHVWFITLGLPVLLHGYFMRDGVLSPGTGRSLLTDGWPCSVLVFSQIQIHGYLLLCKCPGASLTGLHSLLILFLSTFLRDFSWPQPGTQHGAKRILDLIWIWQSCVLMSKPGGLCTVCSSLSYV